MPQITDPQNPNAAPPSVAEAQEILDAAQAAAKEQAKHRAEEERRAASELKNLQRRAEGDVTAVEVVVERALVDAKQLASTRPPRFLRTYARAYLHGTAQRPGELAPPETTLADADRAAGVLLDAARGAAAVHGRLCDPLGEVFLPEGDDLAVRADDAECTAWHAFVNRVKAIASES
jgi:hypothetical protein